MMSLRLGSSMDRLVLDCTSRLEAFRLFLQRDDPRAPSIPLVPLFIHSNYILKLHIRHKTDSHTV